MNSFFVDLNHLDLMSVSGSDAEKFLQGQLTCDLETVTDEKSCLGVSCDNKGRVLTSFHLLKLKNSFFLEMQAGVLALLQPVLEKYKVFFKCDIEEASTSYYRYGLTGEKCKILLAKLFPALPDEVNQVSSHEGKHLIKLSDSPLRFKLWVEPVSQQETLNVLKQSLTEGSNADWELLNIQAGLFQIEVADSGLYTPQILNYDLAGLISFTKGCYTGQEIVARMHYLGKAKKRLYRLKIKSEQNITTGTSIKSDDNSLLGKVLKVLATQENSYEVLATLKSEAGNSNSLKIGEQPEAQVTLVKADC